MSERPDIVLQNGAATLRFFWAEDRFQHEVRVGDDFFLSVTRPDLETPVFTDLHQQGGVVFLSGLSDDRHWSASVESEGNAFAFDVACRMHSPVGAIGSLYSPSQASAPSIFGPQELPSSLPGTARYRYCLPTSDSLGRA